MVVASWEREKSRIADGNDPNRAERISALRDQLTDRLWRKLQRYIILTWRCFCHGNFDRK